MPSTRRYAKPWQWLSYLAFNAAALAVAWLRELRKGNQAAVAAKLKGIREGLKAKIPPPPPLTAPASASPAATAGTSATAPDAPASAARGR